MTSRRGCWRKPGTTRADEDEADLDESLPSTPDFTPLILETPDRKREAIVVDRVDGVADEDAEDTKEGEEEEEA